MTWREVFYVLRGFIAALCFAAAAGLVWFALHIPLEGGAILLTPLAFFVALFTLFFGLLCVVPARQRSGLIKGFGGMFNGFFIGW
jgi:hypothetical protein